MVVPPVGAYRGAPWFAPGQSYDQNFPDPHVVMHDGVYYAYSTNTGGPLLPTMTSADLETWTAHAAWLPNVWNDDPFYNDGLVRPPAWAASVGGTAEVWAPAVAQVGEDWLAYFAVRETSGSRPRHCISVAAGPHPLGPFEDHTAEPLTCGLGPGGAIDPWLHIDGAGTPWLLWKTEPSLKRVGPVPPIPAAIWSQPLTANGRHLRPDREPTLLLVAEANSWEGGVIENPSLLRIEGDLVLVYSGNAFGSPDYAVGWARCKSPAGPCERAATEPILSSRGDINGPGGAALFTDAAGDTQIAYHAWNAPFASYPDYPSCDSDRDGRCVDGGQRFLHIEPLCRLPSGDLHVGLPEGWVFCDSDPSAWHGPSIAWLKSAGLSKGVSPARFAPDRPLTRAEAVTMLWRWAGSTPPAAPMPFVDVESGAYYTDAVAWAAGIGLVRGTSATTFEPHMVANRSHLAAILHRAAGLPAAVHATHFTDVDANSFYTEAVGWLAATGLTTGLTAEMYAPHEPTTRAQLATLLCRFSRLEIDSADMAAAVARCPGN